MNTDIRLSCGFWSHPKTKRLVKRLGLEGARSLQILWLWAAQERPSGCLSGMDAEAIELAADWNGEDGSFFGECLGRWIDESEEGFCLHDWEDHNAWASEADNRSDTARLSRLARVNRDAAAGLRADGRTGITKDEYRLYAEGTPYERRTTVPTTPAPSPTLRTKEEPSLRSGSCPEVAEPPTGQPPAELPKLVGTLPLAGKDAYGKPKVFEVRQDYVDELSPLYPAVDVLQALRSMKGWLSADSKRLKTAKGIKRFITGWLDRDQNKGGNMPAARASPGQAQPRTYQDHRREESRTTAIELMHVMGMTGGLGHGSVDEAGNLAGDAVFQPALGELGAEVAGGTGRA